MAAVLLTWHGTLRKDRFRYHLKVEPTEFADGLDVMYLCVWYLA